MLAYLEYSDAQGLKVLVHLKLGRIIWLAGATINIGWVTHGKACLHHEFSKIPTSSYDEDLALLRIGHGFLRLPALLDLNSNTTLLLKVSENFFHPSQGKSKVLIYRGNEE